MKRKLVLSLFVLMVFLIPISASAAIVELHFDCSDIAVFDGRATTSWVPTGFNVSFGNISSDGDCYHVGSYGLEESLIYGPMYYNTIEKPFLLGDFYNMTLDIEFSGNVTEEVGYLLVVLHDVTGTSVIGIRVYDGWPGQTRMACIGWQYCLNGSFNFNSEDLMDCGRKEIILYRNGNSLYVDVAGHYYDSHIVILETGELEREINYISMMFCKHPSYDPISTMKIFDMELFYEVEDVTTTTTTETISTIVTTIAENDNLLELVIAGTIGGVVALSGVFVFKKVTGNKEGDK